MLLRIITISLLGFGLMSCQTVDKKYWLAIFPIINTGNAIIESGDSICIKYLPYRDTIDCNFVLRSDSIFDKSDNLIGVKRGEDIVTFGYNSEIVYKKFEPSRFGLPYDSIFSILTNKSWMIRQGEYEYRLDFKDYPVGYNKKLYPVIRHRLSRNDTLVTPFRFWTTHWFLESFADTYILGINYIGVNYQLFKIIEMKDMEIILESINEYAYGFFETDTTKTIGQLYKLGVIPKYQRDSMGDISSFLSGSFIVTDQKSDSVSSTARSWRFKMDCSSKDISRIRFNSDSLEIVYTSGYKRKHNFKIDHTGRFLILDEGIQPYDYLEFNVSDSCLRFYDRIPSRCPNARSYYTVMDTRLILSRNTLPNRR